MLRDKYTFPRLRAERSIDKPTRLQLFHTCVSCTSQQAASDARHYLEADVDDVMRYGLPASRDAAGQRCAHPFWSLSLTDHVNCLQLTTIRLGDS